MTEQELYAEILTLLRQMTEALERSAVAQERQAEAMGDLGLALTRIWNALQEMMV